jgi:hypothetical protein
MTAGFAHKKEWPLRLGGAIGLQRFWQRATVANQTGLASASAIAALVVVAAAIVVVAAAAIVAIVTVVEIAAGVAIVAITSEAAVVVAVAEELVPVIALVDDDSVEDPAAGNPDAVAEVAGGPNVTWSWAGRNVLRAGANVNANLRCLRGRCCESQSADCHCCCKHPLRDVFHNFSIPADRVEPLFRPLRLRAA